MITVDKLLTKVRSKIYHLRNVEWRTPEFANFDYNSEYAIQQSNLLCKYIEQDNPIFIGRFGTVELDYYLRGQYLLHKKRNFIESLFGAPACWPIQEKQGALSVQAGVFPYSNDMLLEFSNEYRAAVENLDVLVSWVKKEDYLYSQQGGGKKWY